MHPYQHASTHPSRAALVIADTGERLSYRSEEGEELPTGEAGIIYFDTPPAGDSHT